MLYYLASARNHFQGSKVLAEQQREGASEVRIVDLTVPDPDYRALLAEIFASDSVVVW